MSRRSSQTHQYSDLLPHSRSLKAIPVFQLHYIYEISSRGFWSRRRKEVLKWRSCGWHPGLLWGEDVYFVGVVVNLFSRIRCFLAMYHTHQTQYIILCNNSTYLWIGPPHSQLPTIQLDPILLHHLKRILRILLDRKRDVSYTFGYTSSMF